MGKSLAAVMQAPRAARTGAEQRRGGGEERVGTSSAADAPTKPWGAAVPAATAVRFASTHAHALHPAKGAGSTYSSPHRPRIGSPPKPEARSCAASSSTQRSCGTNKTGQSSTHHSVAGAARGAQLRRVELHIGCLVLSRQLHRVPPGAQPLSALDLRDDSRGTAPGARH